MVAPWRKLKIRLTEHYAFLHYDRAAEPLMWFGRDDYELAKRGAGRLCVLGDLDVTEEVLRMEVTLQVASTPGPEVCL